MAVSTAVFLAAAMVAALGATVAPVSAATPVGPFTVDMTNREDVRQLYYRVHQASENVPIGWTGDVATCNPGTVSDDYLEATLTRINYFRAMAGVPSNVLFTAENNAKAQATALIMSAQRELSHAPPQSWKCWTQLGLDGASSNLSLGNTGPQAIDSLMNDSGFLVNGKGESNTVGHRRNMLNPQVLTMGSGSIPTNPAGPAAEAQFMQATAAPVQPARDGYVAWPPKGFVPYQTVYPLWSFVLRGGDFTNATVTMTRNGAAVPAAIVTRQNFAGPGLVWQADGLAPGNAWPRPANDDTLSVSIGNVIVDGVAQAFNYDVTIFDPALADPARTPLLVTGADAPPINVAAAYTANTIPNATGYQWRSTKLAPFTLVDGAEGGLVNFDAVVDMYNPVSTISAAAGASSFRLTIGQPKLPPANGTATLTFKPILVPNVDSQLAFKSRPFATANVRTVVQASIDEGVTWTTIFTEQLTNEAAFADRTVPLTDFAGRLVKIRFRAEPAFTGNWSCCASEGWYVDDIGFTNTNAVVGAPVLSDVAATPTFTVTPTDASLIDIQVRPQFPGSGFGDWSPVKRITPAAAAVAPTITTEPAAVTVTAGQPATFIVIAAGTAPLSYTWSFNGVELVDGPGVTGSRSPTLTIANSQPASAGSYMVRVTNDAGAVNSVAAILTVNVPPPVLDLPAALDNNTFTWSTNGDTNWAGQTTVTHDGVDAARSGVVVDGQQSTLTAANVQGPATVSFWWKVDSEPNFDFLGVSLDGVVQAPRISGNVDWVQRTVAVPAGVHQLQWVYSKDGSVSTGADAGWVDEITIVAAPTPPTPPATPALAAAIDAPGLTVTGGGNQPWAAQTTVTHDGVDAARSGVVVDGQQSTLTAANVQGPATVSFWWKVDSEPNFDFLGVSLDGVVQAPRISGNVDWVQRTVAVPAGVHQLQWVYSKDGSVSTGADAGWVDEVTITPVAGPPPPNPAESALATALDTTVLTIADGGDGPWTSQTAVTHDGVDAARSGVVTNNQSSAMQTTVNGPATLAFWWKVESEANFDFLVVEVDGARPFPAISGNVDWVQKTVALGPGPHTVRWIYTKDLSVSNGADAGFVDQVTLN